MKLAFQLERVQRGLDPSDGKPIPTVGCGVREVRIRDRGGAYRAIYVAQFEDTVFVLHCFEKNTQRARQHDLDLATQRFKDLLKERTR